MPALDKGTNLYEQFERVCAILKENGENLNARALAAVIIPAIANDIIDASADASKAARDRHEPFDAVSWFMESEQKAVRGKIAAQYGRFFTAPNNVQNTWLAPSGLMDKVVSKGRDTTDYDG